MDVARVVILVAAVTLIAGAVAGIVSAVSAAGNAAQAFYDTPLLERYGYSEGSVRELTEALSWLLDPVRTGLLAVSGVFLIVLVVRVVQWVMS